MTLFRIVPHRATALAAALVLSAGGCQSVFDPAPFNPSGSGGVVPTFKDFAVAAASLKTLAANYETQRNAMMRQKLAFDVPMFGLGVASAANGIFHGAQAATLAFGLGSAGIAGGSIYFAPQTRINAYTSANQSMVCAFGVADRMAGEDATENAPPALTTQALRQTLTTEIAAAGVQLTTTASSDSKDLLAARDAASKALTDIEAADALRTSGTFQLEGFANDVINVADAKIVAGSQNITAALAALPKQTSAAAAASSPPASKPVARPGVAARFVVPSPDLTQLLTDDAAAAEIVAKRVTAAWSGFAKCTAS